MSTPKERAEVIHRLGRLGISYQDAEQLRRCATALQRWFELECGTDNDRVSVSIERDENSLTCTQCGHQSFGDSVTPNCPCPKCNDVAPLRHLGGNKPFLRTQYQGLNGQWVDRRQSVPDREASARKRLAATMACYPELVPYVQSDPRGASLYILRKADVNGCEVSSVYPRGVAVY